METCKDCKSWKDTGRPLGYCGRHKTIPTPEIYCLLCADFEPKDMNSNVVEFKEMSSAKCE